MEDYYEYLDSNGVTTLYKLIKDDTVALIDSYSVTINGITANLDNHVSNVDIHTPIATIEGMIDNAVGSLNYATPDYVDTKVADLVNSSPETLDTLKELSDALGNDSNFATTVANQIGSKASKDDVYTKGESDTLLEGKANSVHNHVVSDITDFPTIPTKTSQLINDSGFLTSSNGLITSVSWSDITNKPNFSTVAISGSYNDLSNKPTIPTKTSELTNDSGYITSVSWNDVTSKPKLSQVAISGSYSDLSNTPTIPTKVSQLENDMGFGTGGDTSDCVHKTGNETIGGIKTFNDTVVQKKDGIIKNDNVDITTTPSSNFFTHLFFADKNSVATAFMRYGQRPNGINELNLFVRDKDLNNYGVSVNTNNEFIPVLNNTYSLGSAGAKWKRIYSDDVVHTSGNEYIGGIKSFSSVIYLLDNIINKNNQVDLTVTPTSNLYTHYLFIDKNGKTTAYMQHCKQPTGTDYIGLFVKDKSENLIGVGLTTNKEFIPFHNNTYSLGSSSSKWANVYSTNDITNKVITYSVTNHKDTSSMTVSGGSSWDKGSTLFLYGNSHANYPGAFNLTAKNTTNEYKLVGFPNGTLTWGGKSLAIDENLVHRSGDETINGNKTFADRISFPAGFYMVADFSDNSLLILRDGTGHGNNYKFIIKGDTGKVFAPNGFIGNLQGNADTATSANDPNAVHKTGNETISGVKSFNNLMYIYDNMSNKNNQMDLFKTPTNTLYSHYMFVDKNNEVSAYMQYGQQNTGTDFIGLFIHDKNRGLHGIQVTSNNSVIPLTNNAYSLGGSANKWKNVYANTFNGNSVICTDGNAFMAQNGGYTFLIRNDGSNTYFLMSDKDGTPGTWSTARPLIINNATGVCNINGYANTATNATYTNWLRTSSHTDHLFHTEWDGSYFWTYVTASDGGYRAVRVARSDSSGSANSATYATTQATTDNSTKIATTAWVRTYVNSVVGSGSVGASISAYYSNATTVTAEGNSSSSGGSYPSDYSDYINISPTVGTIYTGSQLFGTLNASASGSKYSYSSGSTVYHTTAKATANFSGAFSASAKYLCTTANAVRFRAYVSQGTPSAMGSPSVVDNSSAKSIFIRVQ